MRLPPQPSERIDRSRRVSFLWNGKAFEGFEGDSYASALYAAGVRVFSRSFKYHRPRGLLCCEGHCPNCMCAVDGRPNVRICAEPIVEGARIEAQNFVGSLEHDLLAVTDKFGGPFTPVGFYYRTMIRPRRFWPLYERFLRNVAGLGKLHKHADRSTRFDVEHRRAEVLVIGGGESGRRAARDAARRGEHVVLVDEGRELTGRSLDGVDVLAPARALGIWEGNLVPVDAGDVLYRFRADQIDDTTGATEQPLLYPGKD